MNGAADQENRLRIFAQFFKGYMGVMPVVTAAVAPLLTMLKAIPVFDSQKAALATYSALLGFLLLAWVFYIRGPIAKAMLPGRATAKADTPAGMAEIQRLLARRLIRTAVNMLPLILIAGSVLCYIEYSRCLDNAIEYANQKTRYLYTDIASRHDILEKWGQREPIFQSSILQGYYLGIFLSAEMAFVVMALREYAYGVLKVPEVEILSGSLQFTSPPRRPEPPSSPPK